MCSLSNVNVNMTKAFIFRFKHISFYLQSEVFLFAGSLHVSSLHDGPVLHAGCRWPRVPHVAPCLSLLTLTHSAGWLVGWALPGPGPANVMSQPLLSLTCDHWPSWAAHLTPPGLVCPRIMSLASLFTPFSCHGVTGVELLTDRPRAGVHCLMTRITLRSGAPVRNPLPSLYSGLCCTPVQHAWGPWPALLQSESPGGDFTN